MGKIFRTKCWIWKVGSSDLRYCHRSGGADIIRQVNLLAFTFFLFFLLVLLGKTFPGEQSPKLSGGAFAAFGSPPICWRRSPLYNQPLPPLQGSVASQPPPSHDQAGEKMGDFLLDFTTGESPAYHCLYFWSLALPLLLSLDLDWLILLQQHIWQRRKTIHTVYSTKSHFKVTL